MKKRKIPEPPRLDTPPGMVDAASVDMDLIRVKKRVLHLPEAAEAELAAPDYVFAVGG